MHSSWERQRRELDSYNTFFSAITGEVTKEGFYELGYRFVGRFQRIRDEREQVEASPDFVLFNGRNLILAEIKSGENINPGHIAQMRECSDLSIEAAQDFLQNTPINTTGLDPDELRTIQPIIVYYNSFLEECKEYEGCAEALDDLVDVSAVLAQEKGDSLKLEGGAVADDDLLEKLSRGFALPNAPPKNVFLTEGMEPECLAFSISYDLVQNNLGTGRVTLSPNDVSHHYLNREVPLSRIARVLHFLDEMGACRETEDGEYEFTQGHLRNIVGIEEKLREQPVSEWLEDDEEEGNGQSSLGEFL